MNPHPQKGQLRWSAHFDQRPQICHSHHKLLCVTARVHDKEHNEQPSSCSTQGDRQCFHT
jgi:hypothetical protein